jgi:hypothetical protein
LGAGVKTRPVVAGVTVVYRTSSYISTEETGF